MLCRLFPRRLAAIAAAVVPAGRFRTRLRALIVAGALLVAACGNTDPDAGATDALKRQLGYMDREQWRQLYDELHPAQQAFIPFELFERCYRERLAGHAVRAGTVRESFREETRISGTDQTAPSTAITMQFAVVGPGGTEVATATFRQVRVDGRWRWTLADASPYQRGTCPP